MLKNQIKKNVLGLAYPGMPYLPREPKGEDFADKDDPDYIPGPREIVITLTKEQQKEIDEALKQWLDICHEPDNEVEEATLLFSTTSEECEEEGFFASYNVFGMGNNVFETVDISADEVEDADADYPGKIEETKLDTLYPLGVFTVKIVRE